MADATDLDELGQLAAGALQPLRGKAVEDAVGPLVSFLRTPLSYEGVPQTTDYAFLRIDKPRPRRVGPGPSFGEVEITVIRTLALEDETGGYGGRTDSRISLDVVVEEPAKLAFDETSAAGALIAEYDPEDEDFIGRHRDPWQLFALLREQAPRLFDARIDRVTVEPFSDPI